MTETGKNLRITLQVNGDRAGFDALETDNAARSLDRELSDLPYMSGLERVKQSGNTGVDANRTPKSGEVLTLAALSLSVLPVTIPSLIDFLKAWVLRPGNPPVKIRAEGRTGAVEVEFDPQSMPSERIGQLAEEMKQLVDDE